MGKPKKVREFLICLVEKILFALSYMRRNTLAIFFRAKAVWGLFLEAMPVVSNMFPAKVVKKNPRRVDVVLDTKAGYDLFDETRFSINAFLACAEFLFWTRIVSHFIVKHFSDACITFCKELQKLLENFVGPVFLLPFEEEVVDKFVDRSTFISGGQIIDAVMVFTVVQKRRSICEGI